VAYGAVRKIFRAHAAVEDEIHTALKAILKKCQTVTKYHNEVTFFALATTISMRPETGSMDSGFKGIKRRSKDKRRRERMQFGKSMADTWLKTGSK
jgi:hypothetical protein